MKNSFALLLLLQLWTRVGTAQSIQGQIMDTNKEALPYAELFINGETFSSAVVADEQGNYFIEHIPYGKLLLTAHYLGYQIDSQTLLITEAKKYQVDFKLVEDPAILETLEVKGQGQEELLKASPYAVDVIGTNAYKNLNIDLTQLLNRAAGIHIRSVGGLGSSFNLSLNGFSGNRIRYFIDGVPMENLGTAVDLNNYPVNLVQRMEVYKGVVPISLSADALGGAINIVSNHKGKSFLDASYSYGSFNTHQVALNAQYSKPQRGYFIALNGFFNHSDNNYWMDDLPLYDDLGNRVDAISIQRFHDQYTSGMLQLKVGLLDRKLADELSISLLAALNRNNYQHPDNNIKVTLGEFHTRNRTLGAQVVYKKTLHKLAIHAYSQWSAVTETVVDTSMKKYNWSADYWYRDPSSLRGELSDRRSLFLLDDKSVNSSVQIGYQIHPRHRLDGTISYNFLHRSGKDEVDALRRSFTQPSLLHKNLFSLAYNISTTNKRLEATAFGKGYWFNAQMTTQDYTNNDVNTSVQSLFGGYGVAGTYRLASKAQFKLSYERAYRLPESYEILGDGVYILPNAGLLPEVSHNINLGCYAHSTIKTVQLTYELNGFYRNAENYIRFIPVGPFGTYENINKVGVLGGEATVTAAYKNALSISANMTYQHLTDETAFDEGLPNTNYQSRVPNIPYLFANFRLGYTIDLKTSDLKLGFNWNGRYVHEFYLTWEKLGDVDSKNTIPTQFIQDLTIECSWKEGKYNLAATLNNFTNTKAYDNFNIQRPGTAFYLKLRCFFLK